MNITHQTQIFGTGIAFPEKIVTNFDLEKMVDTNDQWITERTGIKQRRISKGPGELPSDLAVQAAQMAFKNCSIGPEDIDCILIATSSPDMRLPNTASLVQYKLGLTNNCACLDLQAACSGFIYGMNFAQAAIATGMFKNVLMVGSENLSSFINFKDRSTCILFGDGCGAFILGRSPADSQSQFLSTVMKADGVGKDLILLETGGSYRPINHEIIEKDQQYATMQGQETFKLAVKTLTANSLEALEKANLTLKDVDWFIPHQANIRIIQATGKRLGIAPEKVIINIEKYGNTSAATIPVAMHEAIVDGRIKRGQLILCAAFGSGLTSGATLFRY